jgi:hypothetical protein
LMREGRRIVPAKNRQRGKPERAQDFQPGVVPCPEFQCHVIPSRRPGRSS